MNYEFLLLFVLAHLLGDFVLQTDKIAYLKASSRKGLIIHSFIVGIVQIALLSYFGISGFLCGLISAILHFFIDDLKNMLNKNLNILQFLLFLMDQCLHLIIIYLLTIYVGPDATLNIVEIELMKNLIGFIYLTYVGTITVKILLRDIYPEMKKTPFFQKGERFLDGLYSVLFFCFLKITNFYCVFLLLLLTLIYFKLLRNKIFFSEIILVKVIFFSINSFLVFSFAY